MSDTQNGLLGSLWEKNGKKGPFWAGMINVNGQTVNIVINENRNKKGDKSPDLFIFLDTFVPNQQGAGNQQGGGARQNQGSYPRRQGQQGGGYNGQRQQGGFQKRQTQQGGGYSGQRQQTQQRPQQAPQDGGYNDQGNGNGDNEMPF